MHCQLGVYTVENNTFSNVSGFHVYTAQYAHRFPGKETYIFTCKAPSPCDADGVCACVTGQPPSSHDHAHHYVTVGALVVVVVVLGSMVILLLFLLLRKRRKHRHSKLQISNTTQTNGDLCRRPKSTNLDYMGGNPLIGETVKGMFLSDPVKQALLGEDPAKTALLAGDTIDSKVSADNIDLKPPMENGDVKSPAKDGGDFNKVTSREANKTAGRYSMIDETSSNLLLDLPDLHCDTNNYRKSL